MFSSMSAPQDEIDALFRTNAKERALLAAGKVPKRLTAYSRRTSTKDLGAMRIVLIGVLVVLLIARGAPDSPYATLLRTAGGVVAGLLGAVWSFVRGREWLHARRIFKARGRVRVVEGLAKTLREWNHAYGDSYELWSDVVVSGERLAAYTCLEQAVVEGPVRAYLLVVPSLEAFISPFREDLVAVELLDGATLEKRRPSLAPPKEEHRVGVKADEDASR